MGKVRSTVYRIGINTKRDSKTLLKKPDLIPQLEIGHDYRERYGKILKHMIQIMLLRMHSNIVQNNIKQR